ncbi:MAG: C25 family cysteine peptidase, partial [Candidatus Electryoneaceae bacterium]|nr:C25 family cysteine peptidase [Candidatus Electryoneaceae bacterium]
MKHCFLLSVLTLTLILLTTVADAGQVTTQLTFSQPTIKVVDGYHTVTMPGALNIDDPGTPSLPSVGIWLILAPGDKTISYQLQRDVWVKLPGEYRIGPTDAPHRLSDPNPAPTQQPDPTIYSSQTAYPQEAISGLITHLKRGYALATCLVWPVRWNPSDGSLEYLAEAELVVQTTPGEREISGYNRFFRGDRSTHQWVLDKVNNPEDIGPYPRRDEGDPASILIITAEDFLDQTEEYVRWRNIRGMRTYVSSVEQLVENGNGQDDQESIRDGIIDAYEDLDITYVLLLGDDEQIPHRGLYGNVKNSPELDVPADLYYSGLDGWWNSDGDNRWGELDEADLLGEVYVGRIPADNIAEIERSLNKVYMYTDEPVVDDLMNVLMVGEDLG